MAFSLYRDNSLAPILEKVTDTASSSISYHSRLGHEIPEELSNIATQYRPTTPIEIVSEHTTEQIGTMEQGTRGFLVQHFRNEVLKITSQKDPVTCLRNILNPLLDSKPVAKPDDVEQAEKKACQVTMTLSIAALSRMRMRKLQIELTNRIMRIHYLKELPDDWQSLLQEYITATRDNDYIRTCVDRGLHDPFLIKSERKVDAAILQAALVEIGKQELNFAPPLEKESRAIGGTRTEMTQKQRTEAFLKRVVVSIIGGAFLVGPMWLMILVKTPYSSLIITTVFVFVAGLAAARVLNGDIHVVSVTAAYAAVLVVFVGANGSSA
ncbi:uncharacterized protein F4817DRAFT_18283 [Daldinia loculata]|uniref:uncharacterized protein n=1 Tax=Daldinia loculata TaxID=103429 RepID=UPI0020C57A97|nr:uncharacterized protein F4817DRAFT_18283 [Daldinia loculata]KAI1642104.1 hypothetical protein F4817DRAFT_18283 [Daldinia loculata]